MAKRCTLNAREATRLVKGYVHRLRSHVEAARTQNPEGIHDLRVASRRLRIALAEEASALGRSEREAFAAHAKSVTQLLGKARELDVSLALLAKLCKDESAIRPKSRAAIEQALAALREAERDHVQEAADLVESPAFMAAAAAVTQSVDPANECYRKRAQRRLTRRHKRLTKLYAKWSEDTADEEALHRIRVELKKLRYACEVYATLYGEAMDGFLKRMKATQEALGEWNDARMLRDHIQQAAPDSATQRLTAKIEAEVAATLEAFRKAAKRFFSAQRSEEIRALFAKFHRGCCPK